MAEEPTDVASPQLQHKLSKEQKNRSRNQEVNSHVDRRMERSREEGSILTHHSSDVSVEILDHSNDQKEASCSLKAFSKWEWQNKRVTTCEDAVPRSPTQASLVSQGAVEELCHLRRYYSSQLRRINYNSQEHLGQPAEPGVLACVWEPLRSLGLAHGPAFGRTVRSLWKGVGGGRRLMKSHSLTEARFSSRRSFECRET